jgi:hypothetical protein
MKLSFKSLRDKPEESRVVPPETVEVLTSDPHSQLAVAKMKRYAVRLRHDEGILRVITTAPDHKLAIRKVLAAAGAPRTAVISIKKLK